MQERLNFMVIENSTIQRITLKLAGLNDIEILGI